MNKEEAALTTLIFQRRLRFIMVAMVALTAITQVILQPFWSPLMTVQNTAVSEVLLLIFGLWSWFAPSSSYRWPPMLRMCALSAELALIFAASNFGVFRLYYFLYICLAAKAALQLELGTLVIMLLEIGAAHFVGAHISSGAYYHFLEHTNRTDFPLRSPPIVQIEVQIFFVFATCVVAAMMRAMVAERRHRFVAEQLSDDVEAMILKYERARVSRDIHDSLGHTLTSLNIQLEVVDSLFEKNREKARQALTAAKELAQGSLADVRQSVHMIREEKGSPFDLKEAVDALVVRASRNHDLAIHLSFEPPVLPLFKAHNIFCVIQESLTNALRHGRAQNISIELKQEPEQIVLSIADDGCGFDTGATVEGLGIQSMKERVESIGGTLMIDTKPSAGTRVNVCVPTSQSAASLPSP